LQAVHAPPPLPHAACAVPLEQDAPEQQPAGQDVLLQTQAFPLHTCPEPQPAPVPQPHRRVLKHVSVVAVRQLTHDPPPVPQAALAVPVWQAPLRQQPEGHKVGLQPEHAPAEHVWPPAHA